MTAAIPRLSPKTYAARTSCMAKLDRLDWPAGMAITSYGVRVGLRASDPQLLPKLRERLPPGWRPAVSPVVDRMFSLISGGAGANDRVRRYHLAYEDFGRIARTFDLDEAVDALQSGLHRHVAEYAHQRIFVHAGVVGWRGTAILIPGRSMSGKTTLVAELVRSGATYYSDEYAVLDSRGYVHPFAKPLSIRSNGSTRQKDISVEELGGSAGSTPLPVGLVVLGEYKPGASWRPRKLSTGKAVLALLSNTIAARRVPEDALKTLQQVAARATTMKGTRGEARDIARALLCKM